MLGLWLGLAPFARGGLLLRIGLGVTARGSSGYSEVCAAARATGNRMSLPNWSPLLLGQNRTITTIEVSHLLVLRKVVPHTRLRCAFKSSMILSLVSSWVEKWWMSSSFYTLCKGRLRNSRPLLVCKDTSLFSTNFKCLHQGRTLFVLERTEPGPLWKHGVDSPLVPASPFLVRPSDRGWLSYPRPVDAWYTRRCLSVVATIVERSLTTAGPRRPSSLPAPSGL